MQFNTFVAKKLDAAAVSVTKPAAGGNNVPATIAVNPADTSEYMVTFNNTLTIDSSGVLIEIGVNPSGTRFIESAQTAAINFSVDMKHGIVSYQLPQREAITLSLINPRGIRKLLVNEMENAGSHVVRYSWKNKAEGVYYAQLTAGGKPSVKKVIYLK